MPISPTHEIIAELRAGRMVILVDEEDRENEGDLVMAAEFVNADAINFMTKYARGLVCLTLTAERCDQLKLPMMTTKNGTVYGTNFTISIEAAEGVTTGISAADRAKTIQVAADPKYGADDIVQPGHIFPIRAQKGGVLMRAGHTEAGLKQAAIWLS
jgi:3,4-dihydroxy 2-butanone 4-phosphate synthase / GTP cyclohydrolase II